MHPYIFQTDLFGMLSEPLSLHAYGLLIATGFLLAMSLSRRQAAREGEDPEMMVDLTFYLLLSGLIGARLVFILTQLTAFMAHPLEIFMFWRGGLVWYGGFIGAVSYLAYHSRKANIPFFKTVDILIPYMALAHGFGRLGCLFAGCCFGRPATLPWSIVFPVQSMAQHTQYMMGWIPLTAPSLPVHPTQLYEAGAEFAMFWLLLLLRPSKRFHGQLFLLWVSLYPIIRSVIEMYRGDKERGVYILSTSQYISIGVGIMALVLYFVLRRMRGQIVTAREEEALTKP
jgi:phosphatidylglycerol:prolipoprotein diacylglycerol transferase